MSRIFDEILRGVRHCPVCNAFVDNDYETCPYCSHDFNLDEPDDDDREEDEDDE